MSQTTKIAELYILISHFEISFYQLVFSALYYYYY